MHYIIFNKKSLIHRKFSDSYKLKKKFMPKNKKLKKKCFQTNIFFLQFFFLNIKV